VILVAAEFQDVPLGEPQVPGALAPRSSAGRSLMACSKVAWPWPPLSSSRRWSRRI
jgi:hypothetical protein